MKRCIRKHLREGRKTREKKVKERKGNKGGRGDFASRDKKGGFGLTFVKKAWTGQPPHRPGSSFKRGARTKIHRPERNAAENKKRKKKQHKGLAGKRNGEPQALGARGNQPGDV